MSTETLDQTTERHSEQQARAQMASIREMVAALERDTAVDAYVDGLNREACIKLLSDAEMEFEADATVEDLRDVIRDDMQGRFATIDPDDFTFDEEEARQTIQEDALSVEVRSDWQSCGESLTPSEFCILLCTGGPAVRIVGDLDENNEPTRARLEHQDWGTSWQEFFEVDHDVLLTYARQFYFGEAA